jgi:hypothetical protein
MFGRVNLLRGASQGVLSSGYKLIFVYFDTILLMFGTILLFGQSDICVFVNRILAMC